jgi:hypothetical protein
MRHRCNTPSKAEYKYYGGRGIKVSKEWDSFETFFRDMGEPPEGTSLDRIDPNGNYERTNCRWADTTLQRRNRRCVVLDMQKASEIRELLLGGHSLRALGRKYGVTPQAIAAVRDFRIWKP